ncbi:MAG: thioredoxin family protein [Bacteroidota bacterium]|jgi:thiol-disulfide isomerase/thioredoxin|nr:thioredoxin family protein [Bacteroidota bacterium]
MNYKIIAIIMFMIGMAPVVLAQKLVNLKSITLPNAFNNQKVSFSQFSNSKGIVLIFTSNYCPYSKLYENRIDNLASTYSERGIQFILINSNNPTSSTDDSIEEMAKKANSKSYKYPYLADKEQKLQSLLGATKTPEVYLLKPHAEGFQVFYSGGVDDNPQVAEDVSKHFLKDAMEALLSNKDPQVKTTRATGCMIKKN